MMTGFVNAALEPVLEVRIEDQSGHLHDTEAIIDTGFSGHLTLPPLVIARLGLAWKTHRQVILGDGSTCEVDEFEALLHWDLQVRAVLVWEIELARSSGHACWTASRCACR